MTRNPYAHPMDDEPAIDGPSRVSGLAVSSLIFSLLCCIPGSGFIGTILGGAGLFAISKSQGRLSGRILAFVGVVLGLLGTMGWLWIGVGANRALTTADQQLFAPTVMAVQSLQQNDWSTVSPLLDPKAGVTEPDLAAFAAAINAQVGPVVSPQHLEFWKFISSQEDVTLHGQGMPIPIPMEFKNGHGMVVLVVDSWDTLMDALKPGGSLAGKVSNIGLVSNGKETWLVAAKPAKGAAGSTGAPGN